MSHYQRLLEYAQTIQTIDTHEHLPGYEHHREDQDILGEYLSHYFSCDLVSAGLRPEQLDRARDAKVPLMERWSLIEPYWNWARNTGYGRALDRTVQLLYDLPAIRRDTIEAANDAFLRAKEAGGHYQRVLKDLAQIQISLTDISTLDCDRTFFAPVFPAYAWIRPGSIDDMIRMAAPYGIRLQTLEDYEQAMRLAVQEAKNSGAPALKCSLAYSRPLRFERVPRAAAEADFCAAMAFDSPLAWESRPRPGRAFEDYMMHYSCRLATEFDLPYQIHTGLQEGNGNLLAASDPLLLNNLFYEYPDTRFDIFHMGYPWHIQLGALAKNFRNVFIDLCWAHIISPNAAQCALHEYFDAVPVNKIMGFGGDYMLVDAVPAHLLQAKENIARVLSEKIDRQMLDMDGAMQWMKMLLHENPAQLFGLA